MQIYNTLTRRKDTFVPREEGKVKMYTCGPTVYHYAHIGNLRSYIMEDILEKYLRYVGYDVTRVMNITDVGHLSSDADTGEDKMLKGARREKKTVMEIAQFYTDAFFEDCKKLNITDDKKFAQDLLHATNILIVPGSGFEWHKPDHFRIVMLPETEILKNAIHSLGCFLDTYRQR